MEADQHLFDLRGQVVVVIGGTGVLGGAVASGLASAGAAVAVAGRSRERAEARVDQIRASGGVAEAIRIDATDKASIQAGRETAERRLGPIDTLINAAGVNDSTDLFDLSVEVWRRVIDTNLTSVLLACQVFGAAMVDRGAGGAIINFSSASSEIPLSRVLSYSVSKAGVNILTRYLARELAPFDIRVNALVPGFFPAEQNRRLLSKERIGAILDRTPAKRLGLPDDLVGAAIWLASRRASGFVTGSLIHVDGGFSATSI